MVKKVTSPPQAWKGANGELYPTTSAGHPIDWITGKVDLGGYCDVGGFEGQFEKNKCEAATACTLDASSHPAVYTTSAACTAAGGQWKLGTWTAATRLADITFLVGDWMSIDAPDTGITGAGLPANKFMMADGRQYGTCGSCHNAGYKANDYTRPQPFADYPNYPRSICGRRSVVHGCWTASSARDAMMQRSITRRLIQRLWRGVQAPLPCVRSAISDRPIMRGSATTNPNAANQPTAFPIGASATNFGTHLIGKQFLNSPHGLFYGSYNQIAITTRRFIQKPVLGWNPPGRLRHMP